MIKPLVYGVIYKKGLFRFNENTNAEIPDGAGPDIEAAQGWYDAAVEPDDRIAIVTHTLNPNDYWRGWFYYNDMSDEDEADSVEVNSQDHLDIHWETNNSGGHYDCTKYEHIVNGNIIETINHNEQKSECN